MCDNAILENDGTLNSVPDCYKNQEMCNKSIDNYPHPSEFVPECCKAQKMSNKAVDTRPPAIKYVPKCYKTQEMCNKADHKCLLHLILFLIKKYVAFLIVCCPDKYKTQRMCDKAVDDCLAALKFISEWFVTSKRIKIFFTALHADDNILYFNEDSDNAVFSCNEMGILNINLNNINLDDTNYHEDSPETIIHIRRLAWQSKSEKRKALKKKIS